MKATRHHLNKQLDNIPDGSTYGRPILSRLNGGKPLIDFSEAIHLNKNLDNMPNGTRAAWDSTTQKAAAVDASGNLLLKNINNGIGSTAFPTQASNTYAVIPEMTTTVTTKGNKVLIIFSGTFADTGSPPPTGRLTNIFALFRDGVQISQDYVADVNSPSYYNYDFQFSLSFIDSPTAASHTYDIRWKFAGDVNSHLLANGTGGISRTLQVVELG